MTEIVKKSAEMPNNGIHSLGMMEERLLQASETGDLSTIVKIMRERPFIDVNVIGIDGLTAVAKATKAGNTDVVRQLIEMKCDVNASDNWKTSPLHLAAAANHVEIMKVLILAGSQLDAKNRENRIPIDLALYDWEGWNILQQASKGVLPKYTVENDVPIIPQHALPTIVVADKKKGKKGKKGKKKGKGKKKKKR